MFDVVRLYPFVHDQRLSPITLTVLATCPKAISYHYTLYLLHSRDPVAREQEHAPSASTRDEQMSKI
jgi:hypothetical protein